jgi:ribosome-associated protein
MKPDSLPFAQFIASVLDGRLAEDIRVVDLRGVSSLTDAVVIASATSKPHLRGLESEVAKRVRAECDNDSARISGDPESAWIVMDYFNVIVHLFLPEAREYYDIESLWKEGKSLPVPHAEH